MVYTVRLRAEVQTYQSRHDGLQHCLLKDFSVSCSNAVFLSSFHRSSAPMARRRIVVFPSSTELGPVLAHLVTSRAEEAIRAHGRFTLGLSGGSLVSMLSRELLAMPDLDCSKWVVGFCDERLVSFDDPDSTYGLYKVCPSSAALELNEVILSHRCHFFLFLFQSQLFSKVNIPDSGILTINSSLPVNECAEDYTCKLKEVQISLTNTRPVVGQGSNLMSHRQIFHSFSTFWML